MSELSDLLLQWQERWRSLGAPVQDHLAPGTDPDRVRRVLAGAGFAVAQEVVDWFTWHDGALVHPGEIQMAPSPYLPVAVDDALREYRSWRELAVGAAAAITGEGLPDREDPDFYWEPTWLPIGRSAGGSALTVDLRAGRDACPVRTINAWASGEDDYREVRAPSLTEAVRTWITWLDRGDWTWSTEHQQWQNDFAALPLPIRLSGLI